jgi:hypothetical protein
MRVARDLLLQRPVTVRWKQHAGDRKVQSAVEPNDPPAR